MRKNLQNLFAAPAAPGIILILSGILALLLANSPLTQFYFSIINMQRPINILFIVNDILMTIFFFDVGLEIKRQITSGHLSKMSRVILPVLAALGGVLVPAIIFYALNMDNEVARRGWAIPTATDIAFALGVILLLGKRIPPVLRTLLLTIAIVDDLIAIIIIALFYSNNISFKFIIFLLLCLVVLTAFNINKQKKLPPYLIVGAALWFCTLNAGIHPAISGVFIALAIPNVLNQSIHKKLFPWIAFFILPIFALANAGIHLATFTIQEFFDPVTIGIALGLIFGKQFGVFSFGWLGIKAKIAELPKEITLRHFYGMAILCGIGFTISVFITNLAYANVSIEYDILSKIGILLGSAVSAILGYVYLRFCIKTIKDY